MAIDGAKIDGAASCAARTEHIEPGRPGQQRPPDRWRPQHVTTGGELIVPALDQGLSFGARGLVGGVAFGASLDIDPRVRVPMAIELPDESSGEEIPAYPRSLNSLAARAKRPARSASSRVR
jgi:hypothetical protein